LSAKCYAHSCTIHALKALHSTQPTVTIGNRQRVSLTLTPLTHWVNGAAGTHPITLAPPLSESVTITPLLHSHEQHDKDRLLHVPTGLQDVDASVTPLLLQHLGPCSWRSGSSLHMPRVLQLRAFALTAVDPPAAGAGAAAAPPPPPEGASTQNKPAADESVVDGSNGSSAASSSSWSGSGSGSDRWFQQQPEDEGWGKAGQLAGEVQQVWAELRVKGLPPAALKAAAQQVARSPPLQAAAGTAQSHSTAGSLTQHGSSDASRTASSRQVGTDRGEGPAAAEAADGSAGAAQHVLSTGPPRGGWGLLTAARKRDVAELLLHHGLARLSEPEDCEWLGVRQSRWRAYQR